MFVRCVQFGSGGRTRTIGWNERLVQISSLIHSHAVNINQHQGYYSPLK